MAKVVRRVERKSTLCLYLDSAVSYMESKNKDSYTVSADQLARCLNRSVPTDRVFLWNSYSKIGYRTSTERIADLLSAGVAKYGHNLTVENTGTSVIIHR